jgi:hypothetical protein
VTLVLTKGGTQIHVLADFTNLSERCAPYQKLEISVANGSRFKYLKISTRALKTITLALYMHVNPISRRCYIGITEQRVLDRWMRGVSYSRQRKFFSDLNQIGWDSFEHVVLAVADSREDLERAEIEAIRIAGGHKSMYTYNRSPGGDLIAENDRPLVGVHLPTMVTRGFKSGSEAARVLGFVNIDAPNAVARGERSSTANWWFRFEEDTSRAPPREWGESRRIAKTKEVSSKNVVGIRLFDDLHRNFTSFAEAASVLQINASLISACSRGKIQSAGGWFFFVEGSSRKPPSIYGAELRRMRLDQTIFAINLISGERRNFRNCTVADQELGLHAGAASSVVNKSRTSAGGWFFSLNANEPKPSKFGGGLVAAIRCKPVEATSDENCEWQFYPSAKTASELLGLSRASISKAISTGKRTKGLLFRFGKTKS